MTMVVPLLPGQSRDRVRVGDDCIEYVSLGPSMMVGEPSSVEGKEEEEEKEEGEGEVEIDNDNDDIVGPEADC